MVRWTVCVAAAFLSLGACAPSRDFHGYVPDEAQPADVKPDEDSRSSVLARLGSPSTTSIFDDNVWIYMSATRERQAYFIPQTAARSIVAIKFDENDLVEEVLQYDVESGRVIDYVARETPTRGRELGLLEQIFGNVGRTVLPQTDERTPGDPTGRGGR